MELELKWKKLQNGSDIRGVALDLDPAEKVNLTSAEAYFLTKAFMTWLRSDPKCNSSELKISVGTDSRSSGPALKKAALSAIVSSGGIALDCGLASTPAMFMSCIFPETDCDGAIMITASHLPSNRNGLKFFTAKGGCEKKDITEILGIAQDLYSAETYDENAGAENDHVIVKFDLISVYSDDLVNKIRTRADSDQNYMKPLSGLKIIVDAGNGAGGFFAEKVLTPLGADTSGSQFLDPDGTFPNHMPNPEDKKAMESVCNAVTRHNADFGIIFDTDVDRAGAVDRFGREINRNRIIALMSAIVLEEHPGSTIVTDSITSAELKDFIEGSLRGKHHRFKRGYKNVINEAIRLNEIGQETHLAIETSGHGALKENYFMDDGAYLIAKILIRISKLKSEGRTIDSLISDLSEPLEAQEFRLAIGSADFRSYGERILSDLGEYAETRTGWSIVPENYEGIRVALDSSAGNGWFLLRLSLHDPILPLNIESNEEGGVRKIAASLKEFLAKYTELDISRIVDYL
ncbi:MAG: phosphomannomutase/phosphoglucomutase [Eubacteriales bacterium]|nr:phosphomannomutase/phosphoglucomutase [Eubacteriales bacterium]